MKRKIYDVLPDRSGSDLSWKVKLEGAQRASGSFENKDKAIDLGRNLAKDGGMGQLRIWGKNNKIQIEYTYGKDPRKYKG